MHRTSDEALRQRADDEWSERGRAAHPTDAGRKPLIYARGPPLPDVLAIIRATFGAKL